MNSPDVYRVRLRGFLHGAILAAAIVSIPSSFGQGPPTRASRPVRTWPTALQALMF